MENLITIVSFNNREDYYKANRILALNGYNENHHMEKGKGYYHLNDNWSNIEFNNKLDSNIFDLFEIHCLEFTTRYRKPDNSMYNKQDLGYILN